MTTRAAGIIGACVVAAGLAIGVGFAQQPKPITTGGSSNSLTGPPLNKAASEAAIGRYRIKTTAKDGRTIVVLLDTATGHCWATYYTPGDAAAEWTDLKAPAAARR